MNKNCSVVRWLISTEATRSQFNVILLCPSIDFKTFFFCLEVLASISEFMLCLKVIYLFLFFYLSWHPLKQVGKNRLSGVLHVRFPAI